MTLSSIHVSPVVLPFAATWRAWRTLTRRHFAYALLWGLGLGTALGAGAALWTKVPWWQGFLLMFLPMPLLAMLLLLCLALVANARLERIPRWIPFLGTGIVVGIASVLIDLYVLAPTVLGHRVDITLTDLWFNLPSAAMIGALAALGYMYGVAAAKRVSALRQLQFSSTRASREAYESRLLALQARVEPQFLFDTLRRVEGLYDATPRLGAQALDNLIVYLQTALPTMDGESTLGAEFTLARAWLDLAVTVHSEPLDFAIEPCDAARGARMPPMVLLPLVQHAAGAPPARSHERRTIALAAVLTDGRLRVTVRAAGIAFDPVAAAGVVEPLQAHMRALFGESASLTLAQGDQRDESCALLDLPHEPAHRNHR